MTKLQTLISDAKQAGRKVIESESRTVIKYGNHDGVIISQDGGMMRYGIDLTVAARVTIAGARRILNLK